MAKLKIEYIKTENLLPYNKNSRKHPERQIEKLVQSIKEFGFVNPVVIDKNMEIVAGHGRLEAAKRLSLKEVPCIRVENLTEAQIKAFRILDNRIQDISSFDESLVAEELAELRPEVDLEEIGFDEDFLMEFEEETYLQSIADMEETKLEPFKKTYFLIEVDPNDIETIKQEIESIKSKGVTVEQSSN